MGSNPHPEKVHKKINNTSEELNKILKAFAGESPIEDSSDELSEGDYYSLRKRVGDVERDKLAKNELLSSILSLVENGQLSFGTSGLELKVEDVYDEDGNSLSYLRLYADQGSTLLSEVPMPTGSGTGDVNYDTIGFVLDQVEEEGETKYTLTIASTEEGASKIITLPATGGGMTGYFTRLEIKGLSREFSVVSGSDVIIPVFFQDLFNGAQTQESGKLTILTRTSSASAFVERHVIDNLPQNSEGATTNVEITSYLKEGSTNEVMFKLSASSEVTKILKITCVDLKLEDARAAFAPPAAIHNSQSDYVFQYRPFGAGFEKVVHFKIDGSEVESATTNIGKSSGGLMTAPVSLTQRINQLSHGSYRFEAYFDVVDKPEFRSNSVCFDIMVEEIGNTSPIIAFITDNTYKRTGAAINVDYCVYSSGNFNRINVKRYVTHISSSGQETTLVNGISSEVANGEMSTFSISNYPTSGNLQVKLEATVGDSSLDTVSRSLTFVLDGSSEESDMTPISDATLMYVFSPVGRSNDDTFKDKVQFENLAGNTVDTTLKRFNFTSNGWQQDAVTGESFLRHSGNATSQIELPLFENDISGTGITAEFEFKLSSVSDYYDPFISCIADEENPLSGTGFVINPSEAYLLSASQSVERNDVNYVLNIDDIPFTTYRSNERVRVSFVVDKMDAKGSDMQTVNIYVNGEHSNCKKFSSQAFSTHTNKIRIGNSSCITDLYSVRIYKRALSSYEVLRNYIFDKELREERVQNSAFNDVLNDDKTSISYDKCITKYPCLLWTGPLPTFKGDKKFGGVIFTKPSSSTPEINCMDTVTEDGVTRYVCVADVQGTSSQTYARKNYKFTFKRVDDSGEEVKVGYCLRGPEKSIAESTLCFKADYMSPGHENTYNAIFGSSLFEDKVPPQISSEDDLGDDRVRVAIDGFRCLLFAAESEGSSPIFIGDGCLNNDKGNSKTFGLENDGDTTIEIDGKKVASTKCQKWEFLDNTQNICNFFTDALHENVDGKLAVVNALESSYPDQGDLEEASAIPDYSHIQLLFTWVCQRANFLQEGLSEEEREAKKRIFINEFDKHFNMNHALTYYLFVEYVALADNRAKNMFLTCYDVNDDQIVFKPESGAASLSDIIDPVTGRVEADKIDWDQSTFAKWYLSLYDMDTCLGVENSGYNKIPYYADWDYIYPSEDPNNKEHAFQGHDSVLHVMIEEAFSDDLTSLYRKLSENGKLSYAKFIEHHITNGESTVCTNVVNEDRKFKYIDVWTDGYSVYDPETQQSTYSYTSDYLRLVQGKRFQKLDFMYRRALMLDSKYLTKSFTASPFNFRSSLATLSNNVGMTLTPTVAMFPRVQFGNTSSNWETTNNLVNPGEPAYIPVPSSMGSVTNLVISIAQPQAFSDFGDLSQFYPDTVNLVNCSSLQKLKLGKYKDSSYRNESLTSLSLGDREPAVPVLKEIDISGTYVRELNLSLCPLIENVYAARCPKLEKVKFPSGGYLKTVVLPPSVTSLHIQNHSEINLTCSYDAVTSIFLSNVGEEMISAEDFLKHVSHFSSIRLEGVNWNLNTMLSQEDTEAAENLPQAHRTVAWKFLKLLSTDALIGRGLKSDGTADSWDRYAYITGRIVVNTINKSMWDDIKLRYPEIEIVNDAGASPSITHTVTFYSDKDNGVIFDWSLANGTYMGIQEILTGGSAVVPTEPTVPSKSATPEYRYRFTGWSPTNAQNVKENKSLSATYEEIKQEYTIEFYDANDVKLPDEVKVEYGSEVVIPDINTSDDQYVRSWMQEDGDNEVEFSSFVLNGTYCKLRGDGTPETVTLKCKVENIPSHTTFQNGGKVEFTELCKNSSNKLDVGKLKAISKIVSNILRSESGNWNGWTLGESNDNNKYPAIFNTAYSTEIDFPVGQIIEVPISKPYTLSNEIYETLEFCLLDIGKDVDSDENPIGMTFGLTSYSERRSFNNYYKEMYAIRSSEGTWSSRESEPLTAESPTPTTYKIEVPTNQSNAFYNSTDETYTVFVAEDTYLSSIKVERRGANTTVSTVNTLYLDWKGFNQGTLTSAQITLPEFTQVSQEEERIMYYLDSKKESGKIVHTEIGPGQDDNTLDIPHMNMTFDLSDVEDYTLKYYWPTVLNQTTDSYRKNSLHGYFTRIPAGTKIIFRNISSTGNSVITFTAWRSSMNAGGYEQSDTRKYLNDYVTNILPISFRSLITPCKKISNTGNINYRTAQTTDKLFLFSPQEVAVTNLPAYLQVEGYKNLAYKAFTGHYGNRARLPRSVFNRLRGTAWENYDNDTQGSYWLRESEMNVLYGSQYMYCVYSHRRTDPDETDVASILSGANFAVDLTPNDAYNKGIIFGFAI